MGTTIALQIQLPNFFSNCVISSSLANTTNQGIQQTNLKEIKGIKHEKVHVSLEVYLLKFFIGTLAVSRNYCSMITKTYLWTAVLQVHCVYLSESDRPHHGVIKCHHLGKCLKSFHRVADRSKSCHEKSWTNHEITVIFPLSMGII